MECRKCGACCIAASISSPIPGLPGGKPAGMRCPHLSRDNLCELFGRPERPAACGEFEPMPDACGGSCEEAMELMAEMERNTRPS